ncbi:hypothetical protein BY458DRAFT_493657 [Sporodiniella umbellata]|nr:hypothetical protein BY458DRAFT_493657 [Sporodiniella umbellata]
MVHESAAQESSVAGKLSVTTHSGSGMNGSGVKVATGGSSSDINASTTSGDLNGKSSSSISETSSLDIAAKAAITSASVPPFVSSVSSIAGSFASSVSLNSTRTTSGIASEKGIVTATNSGVFSTGLPTVVPSVSSSRAPTASISPNRPYAGPSTISGASSIQSPIALVSTFVFFLAIPFF